MGNYVGVYIGEKLSLGTAIVRVILREDSTKLIRAARKMNLGVTTVEGHGRHGPVDIIFTVMPKRMVKRFIKIVDRYNPRAFYSIEEVGYVQKGVFPAKRKITPQEMVTSFKAYRTRK